MGSKGGHVNTPKKRSEWITNRGVSRGPAEAEAGKWHRRCQIQDNFNTTKQQHRDTESIANRCIMFASTREKWRLREGGRVTIDGATGFAPCLPRGKSTRTSRLSLAPPRLLSMYDIYMRVISPFFFYYCYYFSSFLFFCCVLLSPSGETWGNLKRCFCFVLVAVHRWRRRSTSFVRVSGFLFRFALTINEY